MNVSAPSAEPDSGGFDPLSVALLQRIRSRAAGYDAGNLFCTDDLADLSASGYLKALVPVSFGGLGLSLEHTGRLQRTLAAHAPATALAVNMHLVWTGVAKTLHEQDDHSLDMVLTEAAAGELFSFGVSEPGNDLVLLDSGTRAEPQAHGGYRFTGTKVFTSLSPAWTRLGTFGRDDSDPADPRLVWAFLDRTDAVTGRDDWNTLGMRASQSQSTVLEGAYAPAERVVRRLPVGPSADPLILAIFQNFEILLSTVYAGIGQRAVELAVAAARERTSRKNDGRARSQDPVVRWRVAEAAMSMDGLYPQIDALARDVDAQAPHGSAWFALASGLKTRVTDTARSVVTQAVQIAGGSAYAADAELGRLYRDVLAGGFHPSDSDSAHATVATRWLGPLDTPASAAHTSPASAPIETSAP